MGGVVFDFKPLPHRLAAVIYTHNAGVVVRARVFGRIKRLAVLIEQQSEIMKKQRKFPERLAVGGADNHLCAAFKLPARFRVKEDRIGRLYDQSAE